MLVLVAAPVAAQDGADAAGSSPRATVDAITGVAAPPDAVRYDPALFGSLEYRAIGPSRGGRSTAVAGHPSHPETFYMGATGGGVWKTTDYGDTWRNISDGYFATPAIGAIRVAPSDPDVVYVGTGSDGIRSNIIIGKGVYRSTDAGESWTHIGLENAGQIGRMVVHPRNPDVVWVAAIGNPFGANEQRGVFKTTDGGLSWENVLFISDSVGVYGLVAEPGDPDVLYASAWRGERKPWTIISGNPMDGGAGIYKSTDGGESWTRLTNGLPQGLVGKIDLSISDANPRRVYALVEAPLDEEGLYRSDDAGESWELVANDHSLLHRPFYFTNIHADPTDADVVYANSLRFHKSTDGGRTWETISTPHVDNHDMWINPDDPDLFVQANDGGVNVTRDGGETWSTQYNQPTAELYQVDLSDDFPYWACAGQQDNTTICVPSLPPGSHAAAGPEAWWRSVSGCETGPAVPKPGDPDVILGNCKGRFSVYNFRTGQEQNYWVGAYYMYGHAARDLPFRFQRVSPIVVSPHDPDVVYHASQFLHRTRDGGVTWETISPDLTAQPEGTQGISGEPITRDITGEEFYSTIYAVAESPHQPGEIWVGTNDGYFQITRDGGENWTNITPDDLPWGGRIQAIDPSPHRPGKAYFTVLRYMLDDWQPYVYKTEDYGRSWTRLTNGSNGIPEDYPVRVVREDPEREGLLFAGTEYGMFVSFDDGVSWQALQRDLPVTPVTDLRIFRGDVVLSTMGRGFYVLDDLSPLRQLSDAVATADAHLFEPRTAYRMRYRAGGGGPAAPEYLPAGATLHYWLADDADEVTLEILDADGRVVRGFTSTDDGYAYAPAQREMPLATHGEAVESGGRDGVQSEAGMHRFIWDLRYPGERVPTDEPGRLRIAGGGPMAVPGQFQVRLTVDGESHTQPLRVEIDPRVAAEGITVADLREQFEFNLRVQELTSDARIAAASIEDALERLDQQTGGDAAEVRARLREIERRIVTDPDDSVHGYPRPMLLDQIDYFAGMTTRADQRPGNEAYERFDQLRTELDGYLTELESLLGAARLTTEDTDGR